MRQVGMPQLVEFAKAQAQRIVQSEVPNSTTALAASAEFLQRYTPPKSTFAAEAARILGYARRGPSYAHAAKREMADLLDAWVGYMESGLASALPFELAARVEAADDLMDQARELLVDPGINPVAPVVIAAAGLEELLRGLWSTTSVKLVGRRSIRAYGEALTKAGVLDDGDAKELRALADVRDDASRGQGTAVGAERAQVFCDRVAAFLAKHRP